MTLWKMPEDRSLLLTSYWDSWNFSAPPPVRQNDNIWEWFPLLNVVHPSGIGLPESANKNTGHQVKFEFQIHIRYIDCINMFQILHKSYLTIIE